jgi:hypothetical protein
MSQIVIISATMSSYEISRSLSTLIQTVNQIHFRNLTSTPPNIQLIPQELAALTSTAFNNHHQADYPRLKNLQVQINNLSPISGKRKGLDLKVATIFNLYYRGGCSIHSRSTLSLVGLDFQFNRHRLLTYTCLMLLSNKFKISLPSKRLLKKQT